MPSKRPKLSGRATESSAVEPCEVVDVAEMLSQSRTECLTTTTFEVNRIEPPKWKPIQPIVAILFSSAFGNNWGKAVAISHSEFGTQYRVEYPDGREDFIKGCNLILIPSEAKHLCLSALGGSELTTEEETPLTLAIMARSGKHKHRIYGIARERLDRDLVLFMTKHGRVHPELTWNDIVQSAHTSFNGIVNRWRDLNPGRPYSRAEYIIAHMDGNAKVNSTTLDIEYSCSSGEEQDEIFGYIANHRPELLRHIISSHDDVASLLQRDHVVRNALRGKKGKTMLCVLSDILCANMPMEWLYAAMESPEPVAERELSIRFCDTIPRKDALWGPRMYCSFPNTIYYCTGVSETEGMRMVQLFPKVWNKIILPANTRITLARIGLESALAKNDLDTIVDIVGAHPNLLSYRVQKLLAPLEHAFYMNGMWTYENMTRLLTSAKTREELFDSVQWLRTLRNRAPHLSVIGFMAHVIREERTATTTAMLCRTGFLNADCLRHVKSFVYHTKPGHLRIVIDELKDNWFERAQLDVLDTFRTESDLNYSYSAEVLVERAYAAETAKALAFSAQRAEAEANRAERAYAGADTKAWAAAKTAASRAKTAATAAEKAAAAAATSASLAAEAAATRVAATKAAAAARAAAALTQMP